MFLSNRMKLELIPTYLMRRNHQFGAPSVPESNLLDKAGTNLKPLGRCESLNLSVKSLVVQIQRLGMASVCYNMASVCDSLDVFTDVFASKKASNCWASWRSFMGTLPAPQETGEVAMTTTLPQCLQANLNLHEPA